jgi:hypothetical protein
MTYPSRVHCIVNAAKELGGMGDSGPHRLLNTDVDLDYLGLEPRMRSHRLDLSDRLSRTLDVYIRHNHTAGTILGEG